jgi:Kelch motif
VRRQAQALPGPIVAAIVAPCDHRPMRRLVPVAVLCAALVACGDGRAASQARPGTWSVVPSAGLARTEVAVARVGASAYVAGGFVGVERDTGAVERLDLARRRWARVRSMPVALNHAAAAAWRGRLYVVGGYRGDTPTRTLLRYDPRTDRWAKLAPMPTARGALAAAVTGDRLYAIGGARNGVPLSTVEVFDLRAGRWSRAPSLRTPREHLAAAVLAGAVYALAGRAAGRGNFATAERLVAGRDRWEQLPDMAKPRGGIAAAAVGGEVVVLGGEEGVGTIREVEAFDGRRRRWRRLADMPTPRHGLGAVDWRGSVVALAGGPRPGFSFSAAAEALALAT